jgi:tripartite-type tricarboxylate transporter receptor subunit TctC
LFFAAVAAAAPATAQTYPNRSIDLVVPFAPGGSSDVIARVAADEMSRVLGQAIVIENIGGAGGVIALTKAARAAPDGYTIVIGNAGTNAAVYWTTPGVTFTPDSFAPIGLVAKTSPVIAIRNDFPAKGPDDFIAFARKNPGKVTLGHAGIGSSNYLICQSFVHAAGIDATLVAFRGAAPALTDLIGGHLDGVCDAASSVAPAIQDGRARGLMVSAQSRLKQLPDVPTGAEAGVPGFQAEGWNAFFAPKDTPTAQIDVLNAALRKAVASVNLRKRFAELAALPASGEEFDPAWVRGFVPREVEKYKELLAK